MIQASGIGPGFAVSRTPKKLSAVRFSETPSSETSPITQAKSSFSATKLLYNLFMGSRYILPIANVPQALVNFHENWTGRRRQWKLIPLDILGDLLIPGRGMLGAWGTRGMKG